MIYMVEMALLETGRRAEWDKWYVAHQHRLLSIPGIRASQRFECLHPAASPFVALHEVDGPEVFTSDAYRASAGPSNTGEWQTKMANWHRNVFRGLDHTPDVAEGQRSRGWWPQGRTCAARRRIPGAGRRRRWSIHPGAAGRRRS